LVIRISLDVGAWNLELPHLPIGGTGGGFGGNGSGGGVGLGGVGLGGFSGMIPFRVMSSEVETSLDIIWDVGQRRHEQFEISQFRSE
ncbi:MAG: hypothetical protein J2P56_08020, partial [Verrucomicrobia bacterium]|nr:hypothetical protein [Verrucomicrobiota bacterium]